MGSEAVTQTDQLEQLRQEMKRRAQRGDTYPEIAEYVNSNGYSRDERVIALGLAKAHVRRERALRLDAYIRSLEQEAPG